MGEEACGKGGRYGHDNKCGGEHEGRAQKVSVIGKEE